MKHIKHLSKLNAPEAGWYGSDESKAGEAGRSPCMRVIQPRG